MNSSLSFSQEIKFGYIHIDSITNSILENLNVDSISAAHLSSFHDLAKIRINEMEAGISDIVNNKFGCLSQKGYEVVYEKLEAIQNELVRLDVFVRDTFPEYQKGLIKQIDSLLVSEYKRMAKLEGYSIVLREEQLLYFDHNNNLEAFEFKADDRLILDELIELIHNYENILLTKYSKYSLSEKEYH